jgi:hypothetical protein
MEDELVLRSVNMWLKDDVVLRQMAFDHKMSKSDIIRAAIRSKLIAWREANSDDLLKLDVEAAKRPLDETVD